MKIKLSKSQWELVGKKTGWMKKAQESYSYGTTPDEVIKTKALEQTPSGYNMHIKNAEEWKMIAEAVNQGIDAHLEGFTRSKFDNKTGQITIHPEELHILLRRLADLDTDNAISLRTDILQTLGVEEI